MKKFKFNKKGFTIVELVIVIAVIAILMGIMFIGGTAISNNAKQATLDSDLRSYEVNLKAMVNDPNNHDVKTAATGVSSADMKTWIGKYFEDEMALTSAGFDTNNNTATKASRASYEAVTNQLDPYGKPYHVVILDNSDNLHTDISFCVYSFGKNKQTADGAATSKWDKDDVVRIVRVVDSVIYTSDIGPNAAQAYQKLSADTTYQKAANDCFGTNGLGSYTPAAIS